MRKIKIAQIGTSTNSHGNGVFQTLKKNSDMFDIAGFVMCENEKEKFPERMDMFEGYKELTLEEVLNNPEIEAVAVETEEKYLFKYAKLAAQHKKHIHMEKPGGLELSDFEEIITTVKQNETVFHTGYMYRYNPYIIELKEQIKRGEFGEILSVEAQMSCNQPKKLREWLGEFPGGMMFFLGCHLVDLVYSIKGEPEKVIPYNKSSGMDGITSKDMAMAVFEYKNGVSFVKSSAVEIGGYERRQLVVCGTKKTVEIKPLEWYTDPPVDIFTTRVTRENENWYLHGIEETTKPFDRYEEMIRSFGKMVVGETKNPYSYDYELGLYKTLLKACGK